MLLNGLNYEANCQRRPSMIWNLTFNIDTNSGVDWHELEYTCQPTVVWCAHAMLVAEIPLLYSFSSAPFSAACAKAHGEDHLMF